MKKMIFTLWMSLLVVSSSVLFAQDQMLAEENGLESGNVTQQYEPKIPDFFTDGIPPGGVLLIPESSGDRVMAFDPESGELLNADFIPDDGSTLATPIKAILSPNQTSLLVSDQIGDVVYEYDFDGNLLGVFAPAGGANTDILNNVRGITLKPNGNLLVTTGSSPNIDCVAEFDQSGNYIGNFIDIGAGGLDSPFDVIYRPDFDDYLVSAFTSDAIHRYDAEGNFIENIDSDMGALEQITISFTGNILVAGYGDDGVFEYAPDGTFIGFYPGVNAIRGVYELPNGEMLVTDGLGVHRFTREDGIIETLITGASARFITFVEPVYTECEHTLSLYDDGGNGWNGATLSVYVDGELQYEDISLEEGSGPEDYTLMVATNDEVEFVYTPGDNPAENYYMVRNHIDDVVFEDGIGGTTPVGGSFLADCDAVPMGQIMGTVTDGNDQPLEGVTITTGSAVATTLSDGTYVLDVVSGIYDVTANLYTYNSVTAPDVVVGQNEIVTIDFQLLRVEPYMVPFSENWDGQSFEDQLWGFEPDRAHWEVSTLTDYGNPPPAARFNWSPTEQDYSYTLVSYDLDATAKFDKLWLQFDIYLNNYSLETLEGMEIMLFDGTDWHSLDVFDNQNGSFDFTTYQYDITDIADGKIINIGFRGFGENSFNINGWSIDNIYVVEPVTVGGTISREFSGEPVEGVEITFGNYAPVYSDAEGYYSLEIVPGIYDIALTKTGFNEYVETGMIIDENKTLNFQITAPEFEQSKLGIAESLEVGATSTREFTISNTGDGPMDWIAFLQFEEKDNISIPAFNGMMNYGKGELSEEAAPKVNPGASSGIAGAFKGSVAYGFEVYPGQDLISLDTDDPGTYGEMTAVSAVIYAADFDNEGNFYGIDKDSGDLYLIDLLSGNFTTIGPSITANDLAYDKLNNVMYAVDYNSPNSELYSIDLATGTATMIGSTGSGLIISMACDGQGNLWGFNVTDDNFYFIDKLTGNKTLIGPVGFDGNYAQSMAWDPETDIIYMAAFNNTAQQGELRVVDKNTGASSLIGTFPGGAEITGFGFPKSYSNWVSFSPSGGTLPPDKSVQTITVNFNANGLDEGKIYNAEILFTTFPDIGQHTVDISLAVGADFQIVELVPGWSGISTYQDVTGWTMEQMYQSIVGGNLTIMLGKDGFFWPGQNLNTLGSWNPYEGYKTRMEEGNDGYLLINGPALEDKTVALEAGLSYLPVLSSEPVDALSVFQEFIDDHILEFVFDIYTGQVLWPAGGLVPPNPSPFILDELYPGVGYLIKVSEPVVVDFNVAEVLADAVRNMPLLNLQHPWAKFSRTGTNHILSIEPSAFEALEAADIIGVFNSNNICCGVTGYLDDEYALPLIVSGKDDFSGEEAGMAAGEIFNFKVFRNGAVLELDPEFNTDMPDHDGVFHENGLSSIVNFKSTAVHSYSTISSLTIWPNPSDGVVNINGNSGITDIKIYNNQGQMVFSQNYHDRNDLNLSDLPSGAYLIKIKTEREIFVRKLILK